MSFEIDNFKLVKYCLMFLCSATAFVVALYVRAPEEFAEMWNDLTINVHHYDAIIEPTAKKYGVDPDLIRAVIFQESSFRPEMRGGKGEIGLMQVMPSAAVADYERINKVILTEKELFDPAINIEVGIWFLGRGHNMFEGYKHQQELALCTYNAGASRAKEWASGGPDAEIFDRIAIASTQKYVRQIMRRYRRYSLAD